MRDWNLQYTFLSHNRHWFVEYLWGIETKQKMKNQKLKNWFVEYLWGIETTKKEMLTYKLV